MDASNSPVISSGLDSCDAAASRTRLATEAPALESGVSAVAPARISAANAWTSCGTSPSGRSGSHGASFRSDLLSASQHRCNGPGHIPPGQLAQTYTVPSGTVRGSAPASSSSPTSAGAVAMTSHRLIICGGSPSSTALLARNLPCAKRPPNIYVLRSPDRRSVPVKRRQ